MRPIGKSG